MDIVILDSKVSLLADWLSIISFLISIVTVIYGFAINEKVKNMQSKAIFNLDIDGKLDELANSTSKYSLGATEEEIKHELHQTETILTILKRMINNTSLDEGKKIEELINRTQRIKKGEIHFGNVQAEKKKWRFREKKIYNREDFSNYYSSLVACHMLLENYARNRKINLI
jgi:hypothetical protein